MQKAHSSHGLFVSLGGTAANGGVTERLNKNACSTDDLNARRNAQIGMKMRGSSCDSCVNYVYNEDYEYYECLVNLDEDEMGRFLSSTVRECPYFRLDDEYQVVRKQI